MTQLPPEGISQSAWDEALRRAGDAMLDAGFTLRVGDASHQAIARAIVAATERERERCALIAEGRNPLYGTTGHNGRLVCNEIASSIRQGSQPSNAIPLKGVVR